MFSGGIHINKPIAIMYSSHLRCVLCSAVMALLCRQCMAVCVCACIHLLGDVILCVCSNLMYHKLLCSGNDCAVAVYPCICILTCVQLTSLVLYSST